MHYSSTKWEMGRQNSENLREIEYFQGFYPVSMKRLQTYVAAECDRMDYPHSPMYDEYPDRMMIHQVCRNICRNIPEEVGRGLMDTSFSYGTECGVSDTEVEKVEIYELIRGQQLNHGRPNWMEDIVRILLLNEMQRRRCRYGGCF